MLGTAGISLGAGIANAAPQCPPGVQCGPGGGGGPVVLPVGLLATAAAHHPVTAAALLPAIGAARLPAAFPVDLLAALQLTSADLEVGPAVHHPVTSIAPAVTLAAAVQPPGQRLARTIPRRPVGRRAAPVGLGRDRRPPIWDGPLPRDVGPASTADQLLRLQRATGVGRRLQPVGFLFLRDLDSASGLTDHPARRPPRIIPGRSSTRQRSE